MKISDILIARSNGIQLSNNDKNDFFNELDDKAFDIWLDAGCNYFAAITKAMDIEANENVYFFNYTPFSDVLDEEQNEWNRFWNNHSGDYITPNGIEF